jgi:hypothetical protein
MAEDIVLTEDWHIALCVIYLLGAVVSLWMILLSPYLIEWLGATLHKRPKGDQKDWAKIFLFVVLFQPVTFVVSAIALWWVGVFAILPPIHFALTIGALMAIDYNRVEEPWEQEYQKLMSRW